MSDAQIADDWTTQTLAEAAEVSTRYIRQELAAGKIQGRKMGRDWVIPFEKGQAWLEERHEKGAKHERE